MMKTTRKQTLILSILFMGLGHIAALSQLAKGILFALCEVVFIVFLPRIINSLAGLITLGTPQPELDILERDNSIFMLMDGIMTIAIICLFAALYYISVRSALNTYKEYETLGKPPKDKNVISSLFGGSFKILSLTPTVLLVLFFVVVPLVFASCVAFTNYSAPGHTPPNNTVDWVGLDNFRYLFGGNALWAGALGRVVAWTLAWAALATLTCYFGGMIMAVVLNGVKTKIAPLFRAIFILPYAIPSVVSLLVWKNMLNGAFGVVNRTLMQLNMISAPIPWLSDPWMAKFMTVVINLWAGFPYFMLLTLGTMTAISSDLFEASKIDGANGFQTFRKITLPLVLYQTAPLMIMSFTYNINNFGMIFFLTGGLPTMPDSTTTSALGTDIMISWIYQLTVKLMKYNYASVLAVMIFVALVPFAIFNFTRTKSFKDGEL